MTGIVVGVDGSPGSDVAVRWAAARAKANGAPLRLVHAYTVPVPFPATPFAPIGEYTDTTGAYARAAEEVLGNAARIARAAGVTDITGETVTQGPSMALLAASDGAGLLVVGSRGLGGFAGLVLGSVGIQVSAHARCPTVVVREPATAGGPVVVGADGSPASNAAVTFAFCEAERLGAELVAVHAWGTHAPIEPTMFAGPDDRERARYEEGARSVLTEALADGRRNHPGVRVREVLTETDASVALLDAARDAALVVVGSRGHGGFAGLLLGSNSQYVLHHAHCPVAVLRADVDPEQPEV